MNEVQNIKLLKDFDEVSDMKFGEPEVIPDLILISKSGQIKIYRISLKHMVSYDLCFYDNPEKKIKDDWKITNLIHSKMLFHSK